jgi:hypothetical protein
MVAREAAPVRLNGKIPIILVHLASVGPIRLCITV